MFLEGISNFYKNEQFKPSPIFEYGTCSTIFIPKYVDIDSAKMFMCSRYWFERICTKIIARMCYALGITKIW